MESAQNAQPNEPLLVTLQQAAELLNVALYSVRKLARRGTLPYKVIGNRWLISYASLKKFAECQPIRRNTR